MSQEIINYGAAPNDGTGDPLRVAFIKTDNNFDQIWAAGPVGSNITILNNTIQVTNTNGNLTLATNGTGVISTRNHVRPNISQVYDIGTANLRYRLGYFTGLNIDGNVTITGNLSAGNISYTSNVFVGDLKGSVFADDSTIMVDAIDNVLRAGAIYTDDYFYANGSPLVSSYGNANVTALLGNLGSNTISGTGNITSTGNISGGNILGNGRQLTGIVSSYGNSNVTTLLGNLGSNTISGTGNITSTGNISGGFILGNISLANGFPATYGNSNVTTLLSNLGTNVISGTGNITTTANISGSYVKGNGSQLTGISTADTGNVTFDDVNIIGTGNLNLQPNGSSSEYLNIYLTGAADIHVAAGGGSGNVILGTDEEANVAVLQGGNVAIQAGNVAGTKTWTFDTAGNLTLPLNSVVYETNIPDQGLSGSAIALKPTGGTNADQELLIYPTVNDANHLHLTTGNLYNTELFLGDDNLYVKLANTGNIVINSNDDVGNSAQWTFDPTGNLTLPLGSIVYETNIPDQSLSGSAIALKPTGGTTTNQQLLIYPTANDGDHIHMTSGNLYTTELFLGSDNFYVKLANTGNVVINTNDNAGNTAQWTFGTGGTTQFPNSVILAPVSESITMQSDQYSQLMWQNANVIVAPNMAINSNFYVSQNNATLDIAKRDGSGTQVTKSWYWNADGTLTLPTAGRINFDYLSISSDANVSAFYAPAGNVQLAAGIGDAQIVANSLNDSKTWTFGNTGNLTAPGNVSAVGNVTAGNISAGSGTITGGNINGANFNGNVAFGTGTVGGSGNITGGNILTAGIVSATGNVSGNFFIGNGSQLTGIASSYGNANVATFLAAYGSNTITTTGNITAGNLIGNISITSNVVGTQANVTLVAGSYSTVFDNTGNLTLPGNTFAVNYANNTPVPVVTRVEGSWTVPVGNSTQSFTVPINNTYQLWVNCNIPNGIIVYNATVSVSNTNVPAIGYQYAWNYTGGGNILAFTSIPAQIIGTAGAISNASPAVANTNVFSFGIDNTSGGNVTVNYGWIQIS
jgi:hypothetical protein